jgi:S1-C subfamily serine protease
MNMRKLVITFGLIVSMVVLAAGISAVESAQAQGPAVATPVATTSPINFFKQLTSKLMGNAAGGTTPVDPETQILRDVYNRVNPSVVSITVRMANNATAPTSPFGQQGLQPYAYAAGSGFMYDTAGHIVTNAHVTMMHAKLTGMDRDSDIAVIQAQGDTSHYQPVPLANSDEVQVGDLAIAIGNPFEQSGTMTRGIISGLHRPVDALTQAPNGNGSYTIPDAIQTDAAINPGNSGGPLLNADGQVIGVNEQIESQVRQSSGVSFAIPSNIVKLSADALIKDGKIDHSWLGIAGTTLTLDLNEALQLPSETHGVYVSDVQADSPASQAGLVAGNRTIQYQGQQLAAGGDVIIAIDKQTVKTFEDLTSYLFLHTQVGQKVTLTVLRNGKQQDLSVTLAARPQAVPKA